MSSVLLYVRIVELSTVTGMGPSAWGPPSSSLLLDLGVRSGKMMESGEERGLETGGVECRVWTMECGEGSQVEEWTGVWKAECKERSGEWKVENVEWGAEWRVENRE